jgi:Ulp1 family protease
LDELLSNFAFKFNLRHYTMATGEWLNDEMVNFSIGLMARKVLRASKHSSTRPTLNR